MEQVGVQGADQRPEGQRPHCSVLSGAVPATGFLRQSGIGLDSRGFIPVNKVGCMVGRMRAVNDQRSESRTSCPQMMQTNVPGVFAAGDAVTFPLAWRNNRKVNIPHWQMAHAQGTANLWYKQGLWFRDSVLGLWPSCH